VRGQRHAPAALYPQERPGTHCTGGWEGPGPVWTGAENLASTRIRSPDRPARSQSLYRLSYAAHAVAGCIFVIRDILNFFKKVSYLTALNQKIQIIPSLAVRMTPSGRNVSPVHTVHHMSRLEALALSDWILYLS
jgi:hypothetical protein